MRSICVLGVTSELGAGTRGASLGFEAVKMASLSRNKSFFRLYPYQAIQVSNEALFRSNTHLHAKYIEAIYHNQLIISEKIHYYLSNYYFPCIVAGDHSSANATIAAIKKAFPHKTLGVVWIDAHADLHSPYTTPSGNVHGMPVAMALAEDNWKQKINDVPAQTVLYWEKLKNLGVKGAKILPEHLVYVAVRDTEPQENALIKAYKIRNYTVEEVRRRGVETVVNEILEKRLFECDLIYVSFDVDSMDSSISVGTGTPVAGGLSVVEAKELNALLVQDSRVCAWEMVEINPLLDNKGNSMAEIAFEILEYTVSALQRADSYEEISSLIV